MNQNDLIDAAKLQEGLTSDYSLAQRLGIRRSRMSLLKSGRLPADEAEIFMLAEMAKIDPRIAAAAVKKEKEKNPAKRAYWEKISAQFATVLIVAFLGVFTLQKDANAMFAEQHPKSGFSINYAK
jgi:hypothetical protein